MKFRYLSIFLITIASLCVACGDGQPQANNANVAVNAATPEIAPASTAPAIDIAAITDPQIALAEGDRLMDANKTEQAIDAFKKAAELAPDNGDPYFRMGVAYGLIEQEKKHSGTSEILPGDVRSAKEIEQTESQKMFRKAANAYEKYLKKNEKDAQAYFNLGRALNKLNEDKESEEALEKAVKLKEDEIQYLNELGAIRIKLAKYREALTPLKKALEIDPDDPDALDLKDEADAGAKRVDYGADKLKDRSADQQGEDGGRRRSISKDKNAPNGSGDAGDAPDKAQPDKGDAPKTTTPAKPAGGNDRPRVVSPPPLGKKGA